MFQWYLRLRTDLEHPVHLLDRLDQSLTRLGMSYCNVRLLAIDVATNIQHAV
jgi:hypothetical protein